MARSLGLEHEFRAVTDRPDRPYRESWSDLLVYKYDLGESAYWRIKELVHAYRKKLGEAGEGSFSSPRSNALWNAKRALRYGDADAYAGYLLRYRELGGTARRLEPVR